MSRQILLLRGVNLGARNRIAMPELRRALAEAGFEDARTHQQSGNVVLTADVAASELERECERLIRKRFGLEIAVVARTRSELAAVVKRDPLGEVAADPKRYQVSFMRDKPERGVVRTLQAAVVEPEQLVVIGREAYAWHPAGVARSKLSAELAGRGLGVVATARNWNTVTKLLALAGE